MMKKVFIVGFSLFTSAVAFSQSLDKIGEMMDKQKFAEAKTEIDKFLSAPKNEKDALGYYYKGRIYNSLSRTAGTAPMDAFNLKNISYDAFRKNQALDKLDFSLKSEFYLSYFDLYLGFYDIGAQFFNNKDFANSYSAFQKSQDVENYILSKGYTNEQVKLSKFDTALVKNIAAAALNAGDTANAIANYRKIVDANITDKENENVYEFLAQFYNSKKDYNTLDAFMVKAKAAYPTNSLWNDIELDRIQQSGDSKAILAKYEENYVKDPNNFVNDYNYAVVVYNLLFTNEIKSVDIELVNKLEQVLKSAIAAEPAGDVSAKVLLDDSYYNLTVFYSSQASSIKETKTTKPEELKKKKDFTALMNTYFEKTVSLGEEINKYYTDKAATIKTKEKLTQLKVVGYLVELYDYKGNTKKRDEFEAVRKSLKF
ncbi:hypothetical protein ACFOWM_01865 [Ferruginibacter yonginensis]|uniref:Tetratricopeptide repeat protein n=1 Tax=Ferruginibacter yonginensis TaxID=1310416 RepID=A0ABV8QQD4_9BACT